MERHPAWITRLETEGYFPIAVMTIGELVAGDIIDVRPLGVSAAEEDAFLTIIEIVREGDNINDPILEFTGYLPNGQYLTITRFDGVAMNRRSIVRFGKRAPL